MNTYTDRGGQQLRVELFGPTAQDLYADLVEAIHIARALQAECEQLERWQADATDVIERWEAAYEAAGIDPTGNLGRYKSDLLADEIRRLHNSEDNLSQTVAYLQRENTRLRAEIDRYELVS